MIRVTLKSKTEFLVDAELSKFRYTMETRGPETIIGDKDGAEFLANEVSFWKEVGGSNEQK